mgnify:CR=1 FL=1
MKLCVDCKHCRNELWCEHPSEISPVTGKPQPRFAIVERSTSAEILDKMAGESPRKRCGPNAIYFEPREERSSKNWWEFWK